MLSVKNVSKEFKIDKETSLFALNDVSLDINHRETVAIIGESGCGKSTLAKLITKIEDITSGTISFEGKDISKMSKREVLDYRKDVQMVFQNPSNVFSPRMKIGRFLMESWMNYEHMGKKQAKEESLYSLRRVHLGEEYFDKYPHELSGGELQRVAIARAIALHPKLLICDEATSALDVSIQKEIVELLVEHRETVDFAILFISHDLAVAEKLCDKVAIMYLGRIVEVLEGKRLKANVKHPYSKALIESVFSIRDGREKKIKVIEGEPPSPINLPQGCGFYERCKYAGDVCKEKNPSLKECGGSHLVACHMVDNNK